jgi:ABC-2 type transport system ATP-binding protein
MILAKNIVYEYPGHRALDDVSFEIPEGSITALVGPNGAGKTTLLRCLAALSKPYSGEIFLQGTNIVQNPGSCKKLIGFLSDFYGLYDSLTVRQSLVYFTMAYKLDEYLIPSRVTEVLSSLNLEDKLDQPVSSLSRGQRQRLAIGQSIIHNPSFLILDEPASGLDPEARYNLSKLLVGLNKNGMTILVSSHILAELNEYANNLLIIKNGKIIQNNIVSSHAVEQEHRIIIIHFSKVDENTKAILDAYPSVNHTKMENQTATINFTGDQHSQTDFLHYLIKEKLPVSEFYEKHKNIQDEYLNTLEKNNGK